jgi:anti-anti-sigma factor
MDFNKINQDGILIFEVDIPRATLKEAESFKNELSKEIDSGARKIIVDLTHCEFIDSTFLGALVVSLKKVTALNGDLRLVGFQPAVHSMFELTRMYRVFESYKSREDAVKSFS